MDYYGGSGSNWADTDLYADTIVVSREGGAVIPRFEAIFIGLVGPVDSLDEDLRILSEEPEIAALHPDEFMAALNPEFMIEWAEQFFGESSEELHGARTLLDEGQYIESLIEVRDSLKNLPQYTGEVDVSESCAITIKANTWITDMEMQDEPIGFSLNTHGPPDGQVHASVFVPEDCVSQVPNIDNLLIFIDGNESRWSVDGDISTLEERRVYKYEITFNQGPHHIVIR
jgi:hypothetical protein